MAASVCVFSGSSLGIRSTYREAAVELGAALAKSGRRVVFGGGRVGLMGAVADAALAAGGQVVGVIPDFLVDREVGHGGLTETITTRSMHERKQRMFDLSDAFVVLPGGTGTLDETLEMLTWKQLGRHEKPIILLNVDGYWEPLLSLFSAVESAGFVRAPLSRFCEVAPDVSDVLARLTGVPRGGGSSRGL